MHLARRQAWQILMGALALLTSVQPAVGAPADVITFNKDIAPIIWANCGSCHRPGQMAPFSLLEYRDVVPRARQILAVTRSQTMPPWLPEPGYGEFVNARRLRDDDRARLELWVAQGAREGAAADLPPPPRWADGWQLGTPDLVVELPQAYMLAPGGTDVFRNFVLTVPLASPRYVRAIELRPGSSRVVHHATLEVDPTRGSRWLDEADAAPGFAGGMFSSTARSPGNRTVGWTPGMVPAMEPPDLSWRLDPGTDLVVMLHLLPSRSNETESVRPSVGLFFTDTPPTRTPIDFKLGSKTIDIPAGTAGYTIEDRYQLPVDVDVLSIYPHAHYLAREMQVTATLPDASHRWLLWIRNWDFHWQDQYRYRTPVFLPRGTLLTMRYTYDNSAANPRNPHRPPQRVRFGPQSSDEMGDLWLRLAPRTPEDASTLARAYRENESAKDIAAGEQLVAEQPREVRWRLSLGASYLEAGRVDKAIAQLEEALRLAPGLAEAHNNLGHALQMLGRVVEAISHFREAVQLAPVNDLVHLNLANALQDVGQPADAIAHFERAITLNPAAADAHNNLGVALGSLGRLDDAIVHFRLALALQPGYADAQKNLDVALELRKASPSPR